VHKNSKIVHIHTQLLNFCYAIVMNEIWKFIFQKQAQLIINNITIDEISIKSFTLFSLFFALAISVHVIKNKPNKQHKKIIQIR
jgi:hypothetical protein